MVRSSSGDDQGAVTSLSLAPDALALVAELPMLEIAVVGTLIRDLTLGLGKCMITPLKIHSMRQIGDVTDALAQQRRHADRCAVPWPSPLLAMGKAILVIVNHWRRRACGR
jgi:hypothetical protein